MRRRKRWRKTRRRKLTPTGSHHSHKKGSFFPICILIPFLPTTSWNSLMYVDLGIHIHININAMTIYSTFLPLNDPNFSV